MQKHPLIAALEEGEPCGTSTSQRVFQLFVTDHSIFTPAKLGNLSGLSVQWLTWPSSSADEIGTLPKSSTLKQVTTAGGHCKIAIGSTGSTGTICIIF